MSLGSIGVILGSLSLVVAAVAAQGYFLERHEIYRTLRGVRNFDIGRALPRKQELAPTFVQRIVLPAMQRAAGLLRGLTPASELSRLRTALVHAGNPAGWDAERVLTAKFVGAAILGLAGAAVWSGSPSRRGLFTLLTALLGYAAPDVLLRGVARRRQDAMRKALPDTLDLLAVTVEAGLGFDAALARVAKHGEGPLAEELNRVLRETQLGRSRVDALRDLSERTGLPEVRSFVLALVQADIFGVSIGRVLKIQAQEMRVKRRQRAEEQAQKIPVKIVFPLVFCILPALFVVLLGPAAINIYKSIIK